MTRPHHPWRLAGLAVLAAALLPACSAGVQDEADKEAAAYADGNLRKDLETGLGSTSDRVAAAEKLLGGGPGALVPSPLFWWTPGERKGTTIPVVVYFQRTETTMSGTEAWGRACRDFVIGERVETREADCPDGTPASPGPSAVSPTP